MRRRRFQDELPTEVQQGPTPAAPAREGAEHPSGVQPNSVLSLQRSAGNQAVTQLLREPQGDRPAGLADLAVGAMGGPHEQEADEMARRAFGVDAAVGETPAVAGAEPEGDWQVTKGFEQELQAKEGGGAALPPSSLGLLEQGFGADLSAVRVHSDAAAAQLSRDVNATAFTHGSDIFLGEDAPALGSAEGNALLAHEAAHVVQGGAPPAPAAPARRSEDPVPGYLRGGLAQAPVAGSFAGPLQAFRQRHGDARLDGLYGGLSERAAPARSVSATPLQRNRIARRGKSGTVVERPKPVPDVPHAGGARPGFSLAGGQQVLTTAFGTVKTIVPGSLQLLEEPAFKVAYDAIYGAGPYSWDRYVVPTYGSLNGFAHNGVNYINKKTAGLHTVVHEMLHNNTAGDWRAVVGSRWDEGTTEVLTQEACKLFAEPAPVCYPGESPVVREALAQGLPLADLTEAYLKGGAQAKVATWADTNCTENWAGIKAHMEAKDWAAAKAALAKKAH